MTNAIPLLANPVVSFLLRTALGAYVILMARRFYADPTGYFRKSMRAFPELPWLAPLVRVLAAFCLWGGCFIVAAAVAAGVLGLHGNLLAATLVAVAAACAWLLLPRRRDAAAAGQSD